MSEAGQNPRIAILGWGSLLWDKRPDFDEQHERWQIDGPALPLEFSRYSTSRNGVLTLAIDTVHGTSCPTGYAISKRRNPDDAIADLRCREGTIMRYVGLYFRDGSRWGNPQVPETISGWAATHGMDIVIWTGLSSNFQEKVGEPFSVEAAIRHIQGLPPEVKAQAAEYVWRAPDFVQTPLRAALEASPWFAPRQNADRKTS
ncbi:hypothetical protein AB4037_32900 [Labrys sp. KB_33_2]|uniref:hypothetical protein n=1 Tax=Labrys sp. KB_33_2 TaxID=3237479 RepID=UPI003F8DCA6C